MRHDNYPERRLSMRLMAYWQDLRDGRPCAPAARFRPEKIKDLWDECFILPASADLAQVGFVHLGSKLAAYSGLTAGHPLVSDVPAGSVLARTLELVPDLLETGRPAMDSGETTDQEGRPCLYRTILLPLGDENNAVKLILGGTRFKVVGGETAQDGAAG